MSSLSTWFGWNSPVAAEGLPDIFPMALTSQAFVDNDIVAIYSKILTDVLERTHGLKDEQVELMWDSCVKTSSQDGLVTMLAKAMSKKEELFLVFDSGVIRPATEEEKVKIIADYAAKAESKTGVYISFKNFSRSDMVRFYLGLEYATVAALHKSMNVSKTIQLKFNELRSSVSSVDKAEVEEQAQEIATAMKEGRDVMLDGKDDIVTAKPDLTAVNEAIRFIVQKLSFYLGLPDSYLIGEQTSGMGTTGENDMRAVERGLKAYFFSIMKPVLKALFDVEVEYKSQDFRNIDGTMNVLKTFSLVDPELLSLKNRLKIVNKLLELPESEKGDAPEPAPKVDANGNNVPAGQAPAANSPPAKN